MRLCMILDLELVYVHKLNACEVGANMWDIDRKIVELFV